MSTPNPYGRKWRRVRAMVLARDGGVCRCAGECGMHTGPCRRPAGQVDHVHALAEGGSRHDPINARAICAPCNNRLGHQVQTRRGRARRIGSRALPW